MILLDQTPAQLSLDGQSYLTKKNRKQKAEEEALAKILAFREEIALALYKRNLYWEALSTTRGISLRWSFYSPPQRNTQTASIEIKKDGASLLGVCSHFVPGKPLTPEKRESNILKRAITEFEKRAVKAERGELAMPLLPHRKRIDPQQWIAEANRLRMKTACFERLLDPATEEELALKELAVLLPNQNELWPERKR